jgi:geranylgeranyl diphosphate synthase type II
MKSIQELQELVAKKVDGFCRKNGDAPLFQPINYIMQLGGKRMRPVLSLMAANLFSDDIEQAVYPAIAIEVFHNFTLMHDDIMDNSPLRRGQPTVHHKWNPNAAILSGDTMLVQSYQLLIKTYPEKIAPVMELYNRTAIEVCIGQQRDMEFEKRAVVSVDEYLDMIRLKTSVLVGGAMQIGAMINGASEQDQQLVYEFGESLGLMYLETSHKPVNKSVAISLPIKKPSFSFAHLKKPENAKQPYSKNTLAIAAMPIAKKWKP